MELSAKLLHDVEFKERWRGYDPEEVDAFLEQVARGIEVLQAKVREGDRGPGRSERNGRADDARDHVSDEELRRVLVLAQRTADTAVREAREEAERFVAEGRVRAAELTAEADRYAASTRVDADGYAADTRAAADTYAVETRREADDYDVAVRRTADEQVAARVATAEAEVEQATAGARQRARDEVAALEARRDQLSLEVADGDGRLYEQRTRAESAIDALQRLLEGPLGVPEPVAVVPAAVAAVDPADDVDHVALDALDGEVDDEVDDEAEADIDDEVEAVELAWNVAAEAEPGPQLEAVAGADGEGLALDGGLAVDDDEADDDLEDTGELAVADGYEDGDEYVEYDDDEDEADGDEPLVFAESTSGDPAQGLRWGGDEPAAVIDLAESDDMDEAAVRTGELRLGLLDQAPAGGWDPAGYTDGGPPTEAVPMTSFVSEPQADDEDDPYLAELRRAVDEGESLSPAAEAFFDQAAFEDDRWKGLRRRGR